MGFLKKLREFWRMSSNWRGNVKPVSWNNRGLSSPQSLSSSWSTYSLRKKYTLFRYNKAALTQNSDSGIGHHCSCIILCKAAVHSLISHLGIQNVEALIIGVDTHPPFPCGGEIDPSILLPGDDWCRLSRSWAFELCRLASLHCYIFGPLLELRVNWAGTNNMVIT